VSGLGVELLALQGLNSIILDLNGTHDRFTGLNKFSIVSFESFISLMLVEFSLHLFGLLTIRLKLFFSILLILIKFSHHTLELSGSIDGPLSNRLVLTVIQVVIEAVLSKVVEFG
jgi:hypothetical protein